MNLKITDLKHILKEKNDCFIVKNKIETFLAQIINLCLKFAKITVMTIFVYVFCSLLYFAKLKYHQKVNYETT